MSEGPSSSSVVVSGGESTRTRQYGRLRNGMEGLYHKPGTCRPSCSRECYQAKLRSLAFNLPAGFRAAR